MTTATATLSGLRDAVSRSFGLDDLDLLCADMDVNPDSVPRRDTLEARAQALIEYALRAGLLARLLAACASRVPHSPIAWTFFSGVSLPAAVDPGLATSITQGVNALAVLAQNPAARDTIGAYRADFENARAQIALLGAYKSLHELLQELEVRYPPIAADCRRAGADPGAWNTLIQSIPEVADIIDEVAAQAADARLGFAAALWLAQLNQARAALSAAVEAQDGAKLDGGRADLKRGLGRGPSQVNTRMVAAVDVLLQSNMAARMRTVRNQLAALRIPDDELSGLGRSLEALDALRERLTAIRDEHNGWQEAVNQLGRIEDTVATDSTELQQTWSDVTALVGQLAAARTEDWAVKLIKLGQDVQAAIDAGDMPVARRVFSQFCSASSRRFRRVDDELVRICHALQDVGAAMDGLLAVMRDG